MERQQSNKVKSTRRRSFKKSFIDGEKSSINPLIDMEENKLVYAEKLEKEQEDWKNLLRNSKYHFQELQKSAAAQLIDKSLLSAEDVDALNDVKLLSDVVKKLSKNVDSLIEVEEINKKALVMLHEKKRKIVKYNECNIDYIKHDIHTGMIDSDFDNEKLGELVHDVDTSFTLDMPQMNTVHLREKES